MFTFKKPDARPREKSASGVPKCRLHDWWIGPMIRFGTARRDSKMKPSKSILDNSFNYVPSAATAVEKTWRRFGWRPIAEASKAYEPHTLAEHSHGSLSRQSAS